MHKLHIIQRKDGSLFVVAVLNPGTPHDVAKIIQRKLTASVDAADRVLVVPYATAVIMSQSGLWQSIKAWWNVRRLKEAVK